MPQNNTYKYLSIVLGIVALIFAILYFTKPTDKVTDTLGDIATQAQQCNTKIAAWQAANGQSTTSADARADLNNILEECKKGFENSQDKI